MVTDEGWLVVVERDFSSYQAIQLPGAEEAPPHNAAMLGRSSGPARRLGPQQRRHRRRGRDLHRFGRSHDQDGLGRPALSNDPADGAWSEPYLDSTGFGTGATPSLMGFGADDRFVVITDGEDLMNVVIYWRDAIPDDWNPLPDAPSRRIAGQLPATWATRRSPPSRPSSPSSWAATAPWS